MFWVLFPIKQSYSVGYRYQNVLLHLQTWLDLMEHAVQEQSPAQVMLNSEAQHKYLTWRAEKVKAFSSSYFPPSIIY